MRPLFYLSSLLFCGLAFGQDLTTATSASEEQAIAAKENADAATETELKIVLDEAILKGVDFLVESQNASGSWGNPTNTKGLNINAPIPGAHHAFRMGCSALALEGLLASGDVRPTTIDAIEKAEAWMMEKLPKLRRAEQATIYNIWGHAYGIRALAALHQYHEGDDSKQAALGTLGGATSGDALSL